MAISTRIKKLLNQGLGRLGLKVETTVHDRALKDEVARLDESNHFVGPVFPNPSSISDCSGEFVLDPIRNGLVESVSWDDLVVRGLRFDAENPWFVSPDSDAYVAVLGRARPRRVVEVGCGNSTLIARAAVEALDLPTKIICIDPQPRRELGGLPDELIPFRVECAESTNLLLGLGRDDVLFIDSSHRSCTGSDVNFLFMDIIPRLSPGVIVHVHDVFLPFEYPRDWVVEGRDWNEQYILHALLQGNERIEVLWPGRWLQHALPDFSAAFPRLTTGVAQSFWFRIR